MRVRSFLSLIISISLLALLSIPSHAVVEIVYMPTEYLVEQGRLDVEREIVNMWNERNPDIQIVMNAGPADQRTSQEQHYVMHATGISPDLYRPRSEFLFEDMFLNLQPFIDRDNYDLSQFIPSTVDYTRYDGEFLAGIAGGGDPYGLPHHGGVSLVLFYNLDLLDEAGLSYPDEDFTWDDFVSHARAMMRFDGEGVAYQFGANYALGDITTFGPVIWSYGGSYLTDDAKYCNLRSEESMAALQFLQDLRWVHGVVPGGITREAQGTSTSFSSGTVGLAGGTTPPLFADFRWDAALIPKGPARRATRVYSYGLGISSQSQHPDEAWEVLKFLAGEEATMIRVARGVHPAVPAQISVALDPVFTESLLPATTTAFFDSLIFGQGDRILNGVPGGRAAYTATQNAFAELWNNTNFVEAVVENVCPEVDAILLEARERHFSR